MTAGRSAVRYGGIAAVRGEAGGACSEPDVRARWPAGARCGTGCLAPRRFSMNCYGNSSNGGLVFWNGVGPEYSRGETENTPCRLPGREDAVGKDPC